MRRSFSGLSKQLRLQFELDLGVRGRAGASSAVFV